MELVILITIIFQIIESNVTRVVIGGDPGAGKTTFVKRLCYVWANRYQYSGEKYTEDEYLRRYDLVIPIILRFIKEEDTMIDILNSELKCLTICQICALVEHFEQHPDKVLLLLDGYDEYTGSARSMMEKVIIKEEISDILSITTSRPHAIEQLRRRTSHAVDHLVRLCGFSEKQVKQYIKQFCKYHELPPEKGEELIQKLFKERRDLLELAQVPIRTEMICIVWTVHGKLGNTLADLYELFVTHMIIHWKTKTITGYKGKPEDILHENEKILLQAGEIANSWDTYKRLQIVFSTRELESALNKGSPTRFTFEDLLDLGMVTKSHPSHVLDESKWSFPHQTIQEYLVAYFLGKINKDHNQVVTDDKKVGTDDNQVGTDDNQVGTDDKQIVTDDKQVGTDDKQVGTNDKQVGTDDQKVVTDFITKCKDYIVLERCEMILIFLCSKYPSVANRLFTDLLRAESDAKKCMKLLNIISKPLVYFTNRYKIDIPLPKHLSINSIEKDIQSSTESKVQQAHLLRRTIQSLLESEKKLKKANLVSLTISNVSNYQGFLNIKSLKMLNVTVCKKQEFLFLKQKIQNMSALEKLSIQLSSTTQSQEKEQAASGQDPTGDKSTRDITIAEPKSTTFNTADIIGSIPCTKLTSLTLIGPDVILAAANHIQKFVNLQELHVDDRSEIIDKQARNKFVDSLKSNSSLQQLSLCVPELEDMILLENLSITLRVRKIKQDILRKATGNFYKLDLSGNELKLEGESLGHLLIKMTTLQVLCVANCNIQAQTVKAMEQAVGDSHVTCGLHTFELGGSRDENSNNLESGGHCLGKLLALTPTIETLNLNDCKLTPKDLTEMAGPLKHTTNIHTLNVRYNALGDSKEGLVNLLTCMHLMKALSVGGYDQPDPIAALCEGVNAGSLNNIEVIDMAWSKVTPGSLKKLGQYLPKMEKLQVFSMENTAGAKSEDYGHVYSNLPTSLQHLKLTPLHVTLDPYLILNNKQSLTHLHRLNVNLPYRDIQILQEVLVENNSQIHVYNELEEDIWKMYVLHGSDEWEDN